VICKPAIRRAAATGDWIVGLGSSNSPVGDISHHVMYAMRVTRKMAMQDYDSFCRAECPNKIPHWRSHDFSRRVGDCIYDYSNGAPPSIRDAIHNEGNRQTDLSGEYALLSTHYYYFGDQPIKLKQSLFPLIHRTQGHKSLANQPYVDRFVRWLEGLNFQLAGLFGQPQMKSELERTVGARSRCAEQDRLDDCADFEADSVGDCES
jgi:Nucleotide modification associated domain 2